MYKYDIPKLSDITFNSELIYNSYFPGLSEWTVLFLIAVAKKKGNISDESYKGQIRSLRLGNQLNPKSSYNCKLTGNWYYGNVAQIFRDVADDLGPVEITAQELVDAIMLFTQKRYNYALNALFHAYIVPGSEGVNNYAYDTVRIRGIVNGLDIDPIIETSHDCNCCWCEGHDSMNYNRTILKVREEYSKYLQSLKKGDQSKISQIDSFTFL